MTAPVVLIEAVPRRAGSAVPVTVRLAGGGAAMPYFYEGQHWRAGITTLPRVSAALDFDGEQAGGGGVAQSSELTWAAPTHKALADLAAYYWEDAPIIIRVGPEGPVTPPILARGLVLETASDPGVLRIALADQAADLKRPALTERFAGTGGIEGPPELADMIQPRAWGRCFNVSGRQLHAGSQIWCFGNPRRPWLSFDAVRDKGVAAAVETLTVLGWQGSAEATFAALGGAAVIEGGGVLCPSIACVKWWTVPAGVLHADIRGETDGGYVETAAEIAQRIVAARSALTFAEGAVAAAVAARPAAFGWRIDNDSTTMASEISELLGGVSLSWLLDGGVVRFRPWDWAAPTRTGRSFSVTQRATCKPTASRKLGYRRNWSPMARGDLAAIVLTQDIVYEDGTPFVDGAVVDPAARHGALRGPDGQKLSVVQILNTPYTLLPDGTLIRALYGGGTEDAGRMNLLDANAAAGRAIERVRVLVDGVQDDVLAAILAADLVRREQVATEASVRRDVSERIIAGERATAAERTTITARIAGAEARVSDLRITTATALLATAAQILTIGASVAGATAQIEIERAASVTRDTAIAGSVTRLDVVLGQSRARIESVAFASADADSALAARIDRLAAGTGEASAAVEQRLTALAEADSALAGSITSLDAELGTARARTEQVSIASVDRDQALASRIDSIDATYGGNSAAIEDRLTALADADAALAGRTQRLEAATETTNARIGREEVARADAVGAVAGRIDTITTRVGASEARITDFAESIDGLRARRGVALDVNGYATGWTLDNDGQTGGFDVVADRFRVARSAPAVGPPQPPQPMFVIEAGVAKFAIPLVARSIDTDVLKVRGVLAENLDFGATGDLSIYYHAVDFDVNNGGGWTALSGLDIISREGSPMQGHFAFAAKHVGVMMGDIRLRVIRVSDGTPVWGTAAGTLLRPTAGGLTVAGTFFDSVNVGTQVQYDVQMSVPSGSIVRCSMRTMTVEELVKRRFQSIQIYTRPGEGPGSGAAGGGQINGDSTGTGGASGTGGGSGSGTGGGLRAAQQEL